MLFNMPVDMMDALNAAAAHEGKNLTKYIRDVLEEKLREGRA